jgi:hypothetical protein
MHCRCQDIKLVVGNALLQRIAATPATCGLAIEVPLLVVVPPPNWVDRMLTPGAAIATGADVVVHVALSFPQFDHLGNLSLLSVAEAVITASS